jgi:hypothetical protein
MTNEGKELPMHCIWNNKNPKKEKGHVHPKFHMPFTPL